MKMHYGLLKEGAEGLNVRNKPGGTKNGILRPNVKFFLTGEKVTHSIEWVEGVGSGESAKLGWVARSWLEIHEETPQAPGPVYVPPVEIPAKYDGLFRNWPEAMWQAGLGIALLAGAAALAFWLL